MDEFEQKLARLRLRGPSRDLDCRVAQALAAAALAPAPRPRRAIPLRWALAAALLFAALGFLAGRLSGPADRMPAGVPAVTVHVVYEGAAPNPFDCTVAADDGLRPLNTIKMTTNNGV